MPSYAKWMGWHRVAQTVGTDAVEANITHHGLLHEFVESLVSSTEIFPATSVRKSVFCVVMSSLCSVRNTIQQRANVSCITAFRAAM